MTLKNFMRQGLTYVIRRHHFVIRQKTQTYNIIWKVGTQLKSKSKINR